MTKWKLTYGGQSYDISDEEKQLLIQKKPGAEQPSGWFEVKLLDGRSLCVLLSVGVAITLEEKKAGPSPAERTSATAATFT